MIMLPLDMGTLDPCDLLMADIEAFENIPIDKRMGVFNTYDLIKKGAAINPDAPAFRLCSQVPSGDCIRSAGVSPVI